LALAVASICEQRALTIDEELAGSKRTCWDFGF
jgi:hypothetical protein